MTNEDKELVLNSPIRKEVDVKNVSYYFHQEYFIEDDETGYDDYSRAFPSNSEEIDKLLVTCEGETFVLGVNKYDEDEMKANLVFYDQYINE